MTQQLQAQVRKLAKGADTKGLAKALGVLVKTRLAKANKPKPIRSGADYAKATPATPRAPAARRTRRGRNQYYTVTGKRNATRSGTWTHYMINAILGYTSTWDAERFHATCENAKFRDKRLDFGWAAKEGYIALD